VRNEWSAITKLQQTSSSAICRTRDEARRLLAAFNPSVQAEIASNPTYCIMTEGPTLVSVKMEYGEQVSVDWLVLEINDFQNFVGVKEEGKATYEVVKELAQMILNRFYDLKLTEIMLFFQRMKYGDYGEMYGCVDSVRILKALRLFVGYRNNLIDMEEGKRRAEQYERDRAKAVSREEYERMKAAGELQFERQ